jgi:hypothetical protein
MDLSSTSGGFHLDATYPDTPKLFPPGTAPLQHAFMDAFRGMLDGLFQSCVVRSNSLLDLGSAEHHRRTISTFLGIERLEDLCSRWRISEDIVGKSTHHGNLAKVDAWYQKGKDEGPYCLLPSLSGRRGSGMRIVQSGRVC